MSGDHNMYQKTKSYLDDFECPRCGHCCYIEVYDDDTSQERVDEKAKREQEPVAWISEGGDVSRSKRYMDEMGFKCNPLYTAPPKQWVGLTDDAVFELADSNLYDGGKNYGVLAFAKAVEQTLKEKNHG